MPFCKIIQFISTAIPQFSKAGFSMHNLSVVEAIFATPVLSDMKF
jgi:hypothetical protein